MKVGFSTTVTRGQESWNYFYIFLGFAIAIEGEIIGMVDSLRFPWNLVLFIVLCAITGWLLLFNGWFQNKVIGIKIWYENKAR